MLRSAALWPQKGPIDQVYGGIRTPYRYCIIMQAGAYSYIAIYEYRYI